jgi:conjugal transfer pilus assembly protein TraU
MVCAGVGRSRSGAATCEGKFINPLTDICWSCVFPLSIGAASVASLGQEDIANPADPVCACPGIPPRSDCRWVLGARAADRCDAAAVLSGEPRRISLNPGSRPQAAQNTRLFGHASSSFYQAHYYTNPVLYWLEVLLDFPCLEKGSFDIAYLTEVDPLWNDDD